MNEKGNKFGSIGQRLWWSGKWMALLLAVCVTETSYAWTAGPAKDPLTRQERCLLQSTTQTVWDGYSNTPITLVFNGEAMAVVSESEIDVSFADLEMNIDKGKPIKTAEIARKVVVLFDSEVATLLEQLKKGSSIMVYLRFWPTWPATKRVPIKFSLKGFAKAYSDFERCQQKTALNRLSPAGPSWAYWSEIGLGWPL